MARGWSRSNNLSPSPEAGTNESRSRSPMVTVARPNKDAMVRALDIYRDAMRPFIVRHLGSRRDSSISDDLRRRMFEAARSGQMATTP